MVEKSGAGSCLIAQFAPFRKHGLVEAIPFCFIAVSIIEGPGSVSSKSLCERRVFHTKRRR